MLLRLVLLLLMLHTYTILLEAYPELHNARINGYVSITVHHGVKPLYIATLYLPRLLLEPFNNLI